MIEVKLTGFSVSGDFLIKESNSSLEVSGHSLLGNKGEDIVCSAMSILTLTTVKSISQIAAVNQKVQQQSGFIKSNFDLVGLTENNELKFKTIIETFLLGVGEIKKKYPDRITIFI